MERCLAFLLGGKGHSRVLSAAALLVPMHAADVQQSIMQCNALIKLKRYDAKTEKFNITHDDLRWLDIGGGGGGFSGGAAHWAATSNSFNTRPKDADNRLLWVAWVSSGGRTNPDMISMVRNVQWDSTAKTVVSYPVEEYAELHNATFIDQKNLGLLAANTIATLDAIPTYGGGALDLEVSFDLSGAAASDTVTQFGIAVYVQRVHTHTHTHSHSHTHTCSLSLFPSPSFSLRVCVYVSARVCNCVCVCLSRFLSLSLLIL